MADQRNYADFDLVVEPGDGEGYRARVLDSPAGHGTSQFTVPFSDLEVENFLLKVGRPRRGTRRLESPEMQAARDFGGRLFGAVFQDDVRLSLRRSMDEVERRGEGLRIRLHFNNTPELASLPWEYLFSESTDQFMVLSAWTPVVRYLDLTQQIEPLTVTGPLRILVMISSPHDYPTLDVEEEWNRIETSLEPLVDRGAVSVTRIEQATLLNLQRTLRQSEGYHIFHYVGHGGFDEGAEDGVLVLEDGQNRSRVVAGRDLGTILHDHRSLRLAVLNACEGARASAVDPFSGTAQSLVRLGIPAVVAMQFEITDDAAIAFAHEFYVAIAEGMPVDGAIGESRRAIFGLGNDIEWGTPVLYLSGDGRLFNTKAPAVPVIAAKVDEPPPPVTQRSTPKERAATPPPSPPRRAVPLWGWAAGGVGLFLSLAVVALIAVLVIATLSQDQGTPPSIIITQEASETTEAPTTTAAAEERAATETTDSTAAPATTVPLTTHQFAVGNPPETLPAPLPRSGGNMGSGCAPGEHVLPDGVWFGYIDRKSTSASAQFDLACVDSSGVIDNRNDKIRVVPISPQAIAHGFSDDRWVSMPYLDWWNSPGMVYQVCDHVDDCVRGWIYVNEGVVTEVVEV